VVPLASSNDLKEIRARGEAPRVVKPDFTRDARA